MTEIFLTVMDRTGTMKSEMFNVLGIVTLGSQQMEMTVCQTNLKDVESLSGIPGAGEIAVVLDEPDLLEPVMDKIRPTMTSSDVLLSWAQIRPDARMAIALNQGMADIFTVIFVFVAFVGVASAQLTAILERQKEFAVLSAIGMGTKRIVALLLSEALVLGTLSWFATVLLSGPPLYHYAKVGFRVLSKTQTMTAFGTMVDPIFHNSIGPWFYFYAAFLCYGSTIAASIYPAVFTARMNPADALRVAQ